MMPHLIPADAGAGSRCPALRERRDLRRRPQRADQPQGRGVPPGPRDGQGRRDVEVRRAAPRGRPAKPIVSAEGIVRAAIYGAQGAAGGPDSQNPALDEALKGAGQVRRRARQRRREEGCRPVPRRPDPPAPRRGQGRPDPRTSSATTSRSPTAWRPPTRPASIPKGLELLDALIGEDSKIASYAAFRKISAEFAAANEEPGANPLQNQKKWMADLKAFLDKYPKADEAPDALLQLASAYEFNAEEDEARKYYEQLVRDFPETDPGKKGTGALRAARPGRQVAAADQGDRPEERGDRHREVPRQDPARDLLGHLGRPGQARPARADEGRTRSTTTRASRSSASTSTTTAPTSTRSSRRTPCPGPRSSSRAAWRRTASPPSSASSRCRR